MSVVYAQGFTSAGVHAGLKTSEKRDMALVVNTGPHDAAAGVFTTNRFCAAPVQWSRGVLNNGHARAVILNSGGANACTGRAGFELAQFAAQRVAHYVASANNVQHAHAIASIPSVLSADQVAVCSTGLIGELLDRQTIDKGIQLAVEALSSDSHAGVEAAAAIMTTDTVPKTVQLDGDGYRLGGMVKGAGMIAPQLATMLCVLTTDAVIAPGQLQAALSRAVNYSFNRIDADGCMSTNDSVVILSSGVSGVEPDLDEFQALLTTACQRLAHQIVGDAEGAAHQIDITVQTASCEQAALTCARAIANSNLLKCAIYGEDPNWGRILASLGTVPAEVAPFDPLQVDVTINGVRVCHQGVSDRDRREVPWGKQVSIVVDLHAGSAQASVFTDDLTHEYVDINAEYE